ncbi:MAG: hypothetical protein IH983_00925 [Planctomycetes bacterium]|nr:hypothetical protein [Planctomycetota bacterium]
MEDLLEYVPEEFQQVFSAIVDLTDAFCDKHLNDEYKQLCREMAVAVCQKGSPVKSGKPVSWASGIVNAVGWVNFLNDPSQTPYMKLGDVARAFGVSNATMTAKSMLIREGIDLIRLDPDWCLPSRIGDNPLVWMLEINGLPMDIRNAPREAQEAAYRNGLIPYIPADAEHSAAEREGIAGRVGF